MGPQHRIRIYVSFDSPFIIRFLEPWTNYVFKASFEDYHFLWEYFPIIRERKVSAEAWQEITWNNPKLSHFDPRTNQCELEVQKIIHL
jgi:hypothetical protein